MGLFDFRNKNRKASSLRDKADLVKNYATDTSKTVSVCFEENRYNAAKFFIINKECKGFRGFFTQRQGRGRKCIMLFLIWMA